MGTYCSFKFPSSLYPQIIICVFEREKKWEISRERERDREIDRSGEIQKEWGNLSVLPENKNEITRRESDCRIQEWIFGLVEGSISCYRPIVISLCIAWFNWPWRTRRGQLNWRFSMFVSLLEPGSRGERGRECSWIQKTFSWNTWSIFFTIHISTKLFPIIIYTIRFDQFLLIKSLNFAFTWEWGITKFSWLLVLCACSESHNISTRYLITFPTRLP